MNIEIISDTKRNDYQAWALNLSHNFWVEDLRTPIKFYIKFNEWRTNQPLIWGYVERSEVHQHKSPLNMFSTILRAPRRPQSIVNWLDYTIGLDSWSFIIFWHRHGHTCISSENTTGVLLFSRFAKALTISHKRRILTQVHGIMSGIYPIHSHHRLVFCHCFRLHSFWLTRMNEWTNEWVNEWTNKWIIECVGNVE